MLSLELKDSRYLLAFIVKDLVGKSLLEEKICRAKVKYE